MLRGNHSSVKLLSGDAHCSDSTWDYFALWEVISFLCVLAAQLVVTPSVALEVASPLSSEGIRIQYILSHSLILQCLCLKAAAIHLQEAIMLIESKHSAAFCKPRDCRTYWVGFTSRSGSLSAPGGELLVPRAARDLQFLAGACATTHPCFFIFSL